MKGLFGGKLLILFTALVIAATGCGPQQIPASGIIASDLTKPPAQTSIGVVLAEDQITPERDRNPGETTGTVQAVGNSADGVETNISVTPTPDLRLPPEDWKNWPVVPTISEKAKFIYQRGLAKGNDATAFSKVGDCQSIKQVLLGIYDQPGRYVLTEQNLFLQETIEQFSGSFNRDGMAVKGGYNAASVLSPMWADPETCKPGEKPIECEYRIHNPSIVIISLEVWWQGRTVERYEAYMRQIIEYYIDQGVLPILSTKADNVEGDHQINLVTARLAYEYDLPLWNFWAAVQSLPNHGIDPNRDGFHITTQAWDVRSFTALRTIDAVWRSSSADPIAGFVTSSANQANADTTEPIILPSYNLIHVSPYIEEHDVTGRVVFDIKLRTYDGEKSMGVWILDFNNLVLERLVGEGYDLQGVSPDGNWITINNGSDLYNVEFSSKNITKITGNYYSSGWTGAAWSLSNQELFYIEQEDDRNFIRQVGEGGSIIRTASLDENPIGFLPSRDPSRIYWLNGPCTLDNQCMPVSIWYDEPASGIRQEWRSLRESRFSNGNNYFAYRMSEDHVGPNISTIDGSVDRYIELTGDNLIDYQWANNEERLASLMLVRSDYSGRAAKVRVYVIDASSWMIREYSSVEGLNTHAVWSPDDRLLLITGTTQKADGNYQLQFDLVDIGTQQAYDLGQDINLSIPQYLSISRVFWVSQ